MRPTLFLATALLLLAAPALAANDVHARNASFLASLFPEADAETLALLTDRAGERDLSGPLGPTNEHAFVGDIWVLSWGPGPCNVTILGPGSPDTYAWHANFWIYEGDTATMEQPNEELVFVVNWNLHTTGTFAPGHWWMAGNTDHWCHETPTGHYAFPFIDGIVRAAENS